MHDHHDDLTDALSAKSPATTLDQIREGGVALVALTRSRLAECERAVFEGRFFDAFNLCQEVIQKLGPLASAESALGALAESEIVRAEQVSEGMILRGMGTVSDVRREAKPIPGGEPCVHIHLTFAEADQDDAELHSDSEVVVVREQVAGDYRG